MNLYSFVIIEIITHMRVHVYLTFNYKQNNNALVITHQKWKYSAWFSHYVVYTNR